MATRKPYIAQPAQTVDYDALIANLNGLPGATPEQEPSRGLLRGAADLGLEAASGAAKGIKFMSDVFGADNPVSQGLQGVSDFAKELQSAQARGEDQRIAQLMKEAEDKGIGEQVKAALRAAGEAPVRQAIGAIGTSVPMIAASMVPGLREASWGTRAAALGGMGGAQGVGVVKSQMYDSVYQRAIEEGRGEQEARALAQQAQAYSPENAGDIALGGMLGVGAALTGFEPAAARAVGGAVAKTAQRGLMQSTLRGTLTEALPEAVQGGQEQVAGNRAEQRAGFDTPTFRGAAGSATLEGLLSAPGGAVGGALDARGTKPAPKLLADQIRTAESVPESGPMTRAANQAVEAKAQQVELSAAAEGAALAGMEAQAQSDLQGLRDFAGVTPNVVAGMPTADQSPVAEPGAQPSAEFIDSPFADRILTVQEMLADPATRKKVRERWGDEGLGNIAYYLGVANRTGLPEKTQENLLGMAERLLSESVLTPIQPASELGGVRRDPLMLGDQPQPQAPALGMDATPSGRFTMDPQGTAMPESRVQAMDAQRRAEEAASLGNQTPRGQAQPAATMQGALGIGMDTAPTGRLLAGQDGVRPETRMDAINIGQADMQRQAEAAQRAEMGLTPDIEAGQQRNAMRPLDGDILNPSGKPFKTLMAAQRAAKKNPGQVVEVTGGFAIRPATMVAAQPEVANDGRGNQDAAGLAEALAVGNSEAGDRAATEPAAVAQGEMLDAIPGQPAGDQPAQGDAGQGQRVGREGYDTPIELDAAQLKTILENTRGEPLATKPAKLEAWRNGTAKTDPNKYPVELAFTTDGRLDVNDGRHRIALAAERGEKVTAFIDGKDAQRAQELLANVQNLPQPTAAQTPADQAPEAARGDGATPAGVPDQGGAAAAVEAAGVGDAGKIAQAINASIAEHAVKGNRKRYAEKVAKGYMSQEDADKKAAADEKTWASQEISERTQKLAEAIAKKDPTVLVGAWAREGQGTYGNEGSMAAFEKMTGIKLRRLNSADRAKAIFDWAGWSEEQVAADVARRKQAKAESDAAYEAKRQAEEDERITERAGREMIQFRDTNETLPIKDYIDGLIAKGFNTIRASKTGAITKTYLANEQGNGYLLPSGIVRDYAQTAARRAAQQPAPTAAPVDEAQPTQSAASSTITADDVAGAEKQAAQMISDRIDGMKAADVQRIAARYLPTVGIRVPMGKARIKAAMTDAAAMNLLGPAGELGIELSDSVKRALTAKMEGRVGEAAAPVAAAAPAPAQPEQQTADQQDDGDGWSSGFYGVAGTQKKYTFSGKPDGHWASVKNPVGQGYEIEYRLGDKVVSAEEVTGSLSAVKSQVSKRVAELDATQATHKDPGQPAETVTQPVIQAAMKKAARNEDTKPSEMRTWLLGEIDKALQQAPDLADYDATVKRVGEKDAVSMFTGGGLLGKNYKTGYVTFDVPGDGTFKVRNSVRGLLEFKRKVAASPGFKDRGQDRVRPEEADSVRRGSGGLMSAITNMIEEGDFEAARDYAEAVGVSLDDVKVPKDEKRAKEWKAFLTNGTLSSEVRTREFDAAIDRAMTAKADADSAPQTAASLQSTMAASGWTAEIDSDDNTIWTKREGGDKYTAILNPGNKSMEVVVLVDGVSTQIANFTAKDAAKAADQAGKAVEDDQAEQEPAPQTAPVDSSQKPSIAQGRRVSDWPDAVEGWKVVGGGKNAPGHASEKAAKIELAKNPDWKAREATILPFRFNDGGVAGLSPYGETSTRYAILIRDVQDVEQAATANTQEVEQADTPKLTRAEAKDLMEWQDLGQKDGIKTHILTFYESKADKDAKRGRMTIATVSKEVDSKTWVLESNGEKYAMLGFAKKRAEEAGMAKAVADGYVEAAATPMSKYDTEARAYGYQVATDGKISKGDKALSPVVKEVRGRLRVEAPDGKLLFSGATTPEAFGEFLRSFWGAEKTAQPTNDRDTFTLERLNPDTDRMEPVTFKRGETIKIAAGQRPYQTGVITGISQAERKFKVDGLDLAHDFGYAYKADFDESARPKGEVDAELDKLEKRLNDGIAIQADGFIRTAKDVIERNSLGDYAKGRIAQLEKKASEVSGNALEKMRAETMEREAKEAKERTDAQAKVSEPKPAIDMTMDEWKAISKDFKGNIDGQRMVMRDGGMRPVNIVKPKAAAAAETPAFSRAKPKATSLSAAEASSIVSAITSRWDNAPDVVVAADMSDTAIPQAVRDYDAEQRSLGAQGEPEGFWYGGKVYLVADAIRSPSDVMRVLFHEVGHYGLRGVFGKALDPILNQIAALRRADVQAKADEYGLDLSKPDERLQAAEEVLSVMAQTKPELGYVKRAIAAIRSWMRRTFPKLFGQLKLTDAEIIRDYILPARGWVERGPGGGPKGGLPAMSRSQEQAAADETARFSRTAAAKAYVAPAMDRLNETFNHPGKLNWWHKTVGSMYNLAERMPAFKPVYNAAQNFINDVSFYAIEAADKAPRLLPRLEDWKDLAKSPITAQDNKAVAAPVFEGTLSWRRDESGKPVLVEDLAKRYASLTPEQKAQRLLRANAISENVLKMWQGMPKDQYASSVNTAFEGRMLKAGIVFTPDELKSLFKLNDAQVALYQEFRQSIDASLDNMGKSDLLRVAGKDAADLKDAVMSAPDVDAAAVLLRDHLLELAKENPDRSDALVTTANDMISRAEKVQRLKMEGYAPLSRFGQYTVDVVVDGERQYFSMFETARDANRMAAKLKMEYGAENVAQGTLSQREFEMLQGITPESLELFGNMLGLDSTGNEAQDQVFQEYLKRTKANRSAMKRLIHRKGIAGYSEDVGRVLAAFVYSNARQTSAALHMGDLGEAVMAIPKGEGELKDAAVELARYVKEPREEAAKMRGWLFAQYLGGSIASAIVNFTQPLTTSAPYLSQFGGMGKSVKALYQAMADLKDKQFEAGLAESFRKRTEDGTLAPQGVHELMAQSRGEATLRTGDGTQMGDALAKGRNTLAKVMIGWGKLFGMAEQINRQSTYVAAYRMAVERGMADPDAFAKKVVDETQFVNNKANKMKFGRGAIGATLMTFKSYSLNWLELFHRLSTQNGREGKMAAAWMLGVLLLSAGASGLPFAEDAEDLADFLAQRLGYNWSSKKARQEFLEDLFGRDIAGFVENGVTGLPGAPIDVSGRLGMGNMIPGTGLFLSKKDHTSDFTEVLGPAGDLAKRTFQAGDLLLSGNVGQAALMIAPKAIGNLEKGADMAATDMYRDARGYKVDDATTGEAIGKAIGFQPRAVAQIQEASGLNQRAKDFYRLKVERINAKWAKAIFEKDAATVDEVRAEIKEWNRQNPDQRIQANIPAILRRVKEMRKTKADRIADTAPKALRASMREEVRRMQEEMR